MLSDINTKFELNECPFSTLFSRKKSKHSRQYFIRMSKHFEVRLKYFTACRIVN